LPNVPVFSVLKVHLTVITAVTAAGASLLALQKDGATERAT
jgi:hypothetical protein